MTHNPEIKRDNKLKKIILSANESKSNEITS
jgi:hypothetical protein